MALVFGIDLIYPRSAHVRRMLPVAVSAVVVVVAVHVLLFFVVSSVVCIMTDQRGSNRQRRDDFVRSPVRPTQLQVQQLCLAPFVSAPPHTHLSVHFRFFIEKLPQTK